MRFILAIAMREEEEMFYLTTHSTHFIYGYMASDIWLRTILIVRKETRCRHIGYYFRLTARVLLYAPSHRQDSTYHGLCYTSRGALANSDDKRRIKVSKTCRYFDISQAVRTQIAFSLILSVASCLMHLAKLENID